MPKAPEKPRPKWEQRLIDTTEPWNGWSVSRVRDRVLVRVREIGRPTETTYLPRPMTWDEANHRKAISWIELLYKEWNNGKLTLKAALEEIAPKSDLIGEQHSLTWAQIADELEKSRVEGSQGCSAETFAKNWRPFIDHAIKLIQKGKVHNGYTLLKRSLKEWEDAPTMKVECGRYLSKFMEFAVARHGVPGTWLITNIDKKELIPKKPRARLKAVLTDAELLQLVKLASEANPRWGNVFRLLTQFGLRPIELQHLSSKLNEDTLEQGIWCNYRKVGGVEETDPRFLRSMYLRDADGNAVQWALEQAMTDGTLVLPTGNDGNMRKLSGLSINTYLHRKSRITNEPSGAVQKYWAELVEKYAAKTPSEWVRVYSFRDSFSIRCHREGVPKNSICNALGHSEAVHDRSYRTITNKIVTRDFESSATTIQLN